MLDCPFVRHNGCPVGAENRMVARFGCPVGAKTECPLCPVVRLVSALSESACLALRVCLFVVRRRCVRCSGCERRGWCVLVVDVRVAVGSVGCPCSWRCFLPTLNARDEKPGQEKKTGQR